MVGYTCGGCGTALPEEFCGPPPRSPCPTCGSDVRNAWMRGEAAGFTLRCSAALSARLSPAFATRDWRRRWAQIQTTGAGLAVPYTEPMSGETIHARCAELHAFFVSSYHLKDALRAERPNGVAVQAVEAAVTNSPELALLADLANLEKHVSGDRPPRSGAWPTFGTLEGATMKDGSGWRLRLEILHAGDR